MQGEVRCGLYSLPSNSRMACVNLVLNIASYWVKYCTELIVMYKQVLVGTSSDFQTFSFIINENNE